MSASHSYVPYRPRRVSYLGIRTVRGFSLKVYTIVFGDRTFSNDLFDSGLLTAGDQLPQPPVATGRPGVGFVILHQGMTGDYIILGWWDNENELPLRVFVLGQNGWRAAGGGESLCVWDLRIVWHEREAYVSSLLSGKPGRQVEAYLDAGLSGYA